MTMRKGWENKTDVRRKEGQVQEKKWQGTAKKVGGQQGRGAENERREIS